MGSGRAQIKGVRARLMRIGTIVSLTVTAAACSDGGGSDGEGGSSSSDCELGPYGDETLPIELVAQHFESPGSGDLVDLGNGGILDLTVPPQGGYVAFVGLRATNLCGDDVRVRGALVDPVTGTERQDLRQLDLPASATNGWGGSQPSNTTSVVHLPMCPNVWSETALFGEPMGLRLSVEDRLGRTAEVQLDVVGACPAGDVSCACLCSADYDPSQACSGTP